MHLKYLLLLLWFAPFYLINNEIHFVLANERVAIDLSKNGQNPGFVPDGMTIDEEGNLYIATWGGSKIIKVDPK